nr:MAG TPA: hypothetical protein [Caudoviricetes sp.]
MTDENQFEHRQLNNMPSVAVPRINKKQITKIFRRKKGVTKL